MSKYQVTRILAKHKLTIITISILLMVSAALRLSAINAPLFFSNTDDFVLFASQGINLESGTQISSGLVGTNGEITANKDVLISADLSADAISLAAGVQVQGSIFFNQLDSNPSAVIFGTQTTPVTLPIAAPPTIPNFDPGTIDSTFSGSGNILPAGSYNNIKLEKGGKLTLSGGTYNLRSLELEKNSTLVYSSPSVLNIKSELNGQQSVTVLPGQDLTSNDLVINYAGDDVPVIFGQTSFLNFKLVAPQAKVVIDQGVTMRGQILANEIHIEQNAVISREQSFLFVTPEANIIEDSEGAVYPANEILLDLAEGTSAADAMEIAEIIGGQIIGTVASFEIYQVLVPVQNEVELKAAMDVLDDLNDPRLEAFSRNHTMDIFSWSSSYDLINFGTQSPNSNKIKAYQKIFVEEAWEAVNTISPPLPLSDVVVGIIDQSVQTDHKEFNNPPVDLGGLSTLLNNFKNKKHGTNVAGVIGANNVSRLMPINTQMNGILSGVLDESQYILEISPYLGGELKSSKLIINNIQWIERVIAAGAQVINMSFGGYKCPLVPGSVAKACYSADDFVDEAKLYKNLFDDPISKEVLFVAAAGNDGINVNNVLPARFGFLENVITVGATNLDDERLCFNFQGLSAEPKH